ncbi:hypothetical protein J2T04_003615 [Chryseobacterium lathyri]|uniref:Uncharacterized protein n=1 Tax=Chryseobacterium lathyri TaxID=395933 RepID=A0ABT9SQI7_9FLAO|nr:hypothetical protein [Chryseobacterium lathyri]
MKEDILHNLGIINDRIASKQAETGMKSDYCWLQKQFQQSILKQL